VAALVLGAALLACASMPLRAAQEPPTWDALADESTIQVVTVDPNGAERDTTIWLAVIDGQGYIRTGNTRWFANLQRDPALRLRAAGVEYPLKTELIQDPALCTRIDAAFREKYGLTDRVIAWFRSAGATKRMRLVAR
jgi:hypothetical protein